MIKIKAEQKYITLLLYVILITILAGIYIFLCQIHGKNFQIENCIFIAIFILVIIFNLINSSEYVSEIRISHSHIEIIYKKGAKNWHQLLPHMITVEFRNIRYFVHNAFWNISTLRINTNPTKKKYTGIVICNIRMFA